MQETQEMTEVLGEKLLPCPFCASLDLYFNNMHCTDKGLAVSCNECYAIGSEYKGLNHPIKGAAQLWNKRK